MVKEKRMPKVTVLLATYNGAEFVGEQIESILKQTYTNWQLLIRDDSSSDETALILARYQALFPHCIAVIDNYGRRLGSALNFNCLLQHAKQEGYLMFCDQDDFWIPDKIEFTLRQMLALEKKHGESYPLLVHTGFRYVDASLRTIYSKKNFSALKLADLKLSHLLAQNPVYGCTAMINKALSELVGTVPAVAESHDYWVALVASAFGKISYLSEKTVLYRQHGNNISGSFTDSTFLNRFKRIVIEKKMLRDLTRKIFMAKEFSSTYADRLDDQQKLLLDNFIELAKTKSLLLFYRNAKSGVRKQTLGQTSLLYISMLLFKNPKAI